MSSKRKPRVRDKAVHVSLTAEEHAEFHAACESHGLLEREMVMHAVRAYRTVPRRLELLEARVRVLEGAERYQLRKGREGDESVAQKSDE